MRLHLTPALLLLQFGAATALDSHMLDGNNEEVACHGWCFMTVAFGVISILGSVAIAWKFHEHVSSALLKKILLTGLLSANHDVTLVGNEFNTESYIASTLLLFSFWLGLVVHTILCERSNDPQREHRRKLLSQASWAFLTIEFVLGLFFNNHYAPKIIYLANIVLDEVDMSAGRNFCVEKL